MAPSRVPVKECNTSSFPPLPSLKTVFRLAGAAGVRDAIKIAARIQSRCVLRPHSVRGILYEAIRWGGILERPGLARTRVLPYCVVRLWGVSILLGLRGAGGRDYPARARGQLLCFGRSDVGKRQNAPPIARTACYEKRNHSPTLLRLWGCSASSLKAPD